MRPVRFPRWVDLSGRLQRAAYMPPLQTTHNIANLRRDYRERSISAPYIIARKRAFLTN